MWNNEELHVRELAKQIKELSEKPEQRDIIRQFSTERRIHDESAACR